MHTPGPWSYAPILSHGEYEICHDGCHAIAFVYAGDGLDEIRTFPAESNAKLIAAAPDMLRALDAVIRDFGFRSEGAIKLAADAISKARGEQ
jgi:hypothetical protein